VGIGLAALAVVAIVLAVGPVGWMVLAGVIVAGLAVKIALMVAKRIKVKQLAKKIATPIAAKPKEDNDKDEEKAGLKPQEQIKQKPTRGKRLSHVEHHPHSTADLVHEFEEHPKPPEPPLPEAAKAALNKEESKLFADSQPKRETVTIEEDLDSQSDDESKVVQPTKPLEKENEGEGEGEGEGGKEDESDSLHF